MSNVTKSIIGTLVATPLIAALGFDAAVTYTTGGFMPSESSCAAFRKATMIEPVIQSTSTPDYPFEAEVFRYAYSPETVQSKCARKLSIDIQNATGLHFANGIGPDREDIVVRGYLRSPQEMELLENFLNKRNLYCVPLFKNTEQLQRNRMLAVQKQERFTPNPLTM